MSHFFILAWGVENSRSSCSYVRKSRIIKKSGFHPIGWSQWVFNRFKYIYKKRSKNVDLLYRSELMIPLPQTTKLSILLPVHSACIFCSGFSIGRNYATASWSVILKKSRIKCLETSWKNQKRTVWFTAKSTRRFCRKRNTHCLNSVIHLCLSWMSCAFAGMNISRMVLS